MAAGEIQTFIQLLMAEWARKFLHIMGDSVANAIKHIGKKGEFLRKDSIFRNWIKADGSTPFPPEAGRYHLYVSYACPWAHRTLICRTLKGLEKVISVDVVHWLLTEKGWHFDASEPGSTSESQFGFQYLRQLYERSVENSATDKFDQRVTVPVLFDKKSGVIVNNESSEILRILNSEFNEFCETEEQKSLDLYPVELRPKIDDVNSFIYPQINNGVYRSGFARTQEAYDVAVADVFHGLDKVEKILSDNRYLTGSKFTEADVRLWVTLIRFDSVYVLHFKCNRKRIVDYPNIWGYVREIYQMPGIESTVNMNHIVWHYHKSHQSINPFSIVPINPILDFKEPHNRSDK